jgi:acylphosphatase
MHSVRGYVAGRVQGVGFRYFVKRHADELAVNGYAKNLPDGRVEFLLQGEKLAVLSVVESIRSGPSWSRVTGVIIEEFVGDETWDQFRTL